MVKRFGLVLLVIISVAVAGCDEPERFSGGDRDSLYPSTHPSTGTISVYQLAEKLGLRITKTTSTNITMEDSSNTVMLFTFTGAQFYVNGLPGGEVGKIEQINRTSFFSESLVGKIKAMMVAAPPRMNTFGSLKGTVVIDAGHGGKDPGAISTLGTYEKYINLSVAKKVASQLRRKGLRVIMTRNSDIFVELNERARISNSYNTDLFVSIHSDSSESSSKTGFTVYVSRSASSGSSSAARSIERAMSAAGRGGNGIQKADFRVLVRTKCPAVLVELGYLSNWGEARQLRTDNFQNSLANAVTKGITDYIAKL